VLYRLEESHYPRRLFGLGVEAFQGLMIRHNCNLAAVNPVTPVLKHQQDAQQLLFLYGVTLLRVAELLGEVCDRVKR
jgi:hypothetical protein